MTGTRLRFGALAFVVVACGAIGNEDEGTANLPSAEMGPFRALEKGEVKGTTAPFVIDDKSAQYNDPAAFDDGVLYLVNLGAIVRTSAANGRTFAAPKAVLKADQPWEGIVLSGPFAVHHGAEIWLYYAGKDGVGVAKSSDGITFAKAPGPILAGAKGPSVFELPGGGWRMLYAAGSAIAEAESADGLAWHPLGTVLAPSADPSAFDAASVGDPCAAPRVTAGGRYQVRVLYTGTADGKTTQIGYAARYGTDGPLVRNPVPAYTAGKGPAYAPPFLYVTQADGITAAIGAAVLDGTTLPPP